MGYSRWCLRRSRRRSRPWRQRDLTVPRAMPSWAAISAWLALALEVDAAIAYGNEVARLKTPALITSGTTIAATESAHATTIRAAFISLGVDMAYVPAPVVSTATHDQWVIKV